MNLSRIRGELAKLQEFAAERARIGKLPLTIFVLPENSRGPDADGDLPLPRIAWRDDRAVCVLYDIEAGQPDADALARLIEGTP
jgi:hypothetical protein